MPDCKFDSSLQLQASDGLDPFRGSGRGVIIWMEAAATIPAMLIALQAAFVCVRGR